MNVMIIEDEAKAASELERILLSLDAGIEIVAKTDSVEDSVNYLSEHPHPDLIFSDIQLSDSLCFEIFDRVHVRSPIVFCTAFDQYTMNAFETNAISYILKPVNVKKVSAALQKFNEMKSVFEPDKASRSIQSAGSQLKYTYKTTLLVEQGDKVIPLQVKDIAFIYLDQTIVKITTFTRQRYFFASSLDEVERMLDPAYFYRANRQFLINRAAVGSAERYLSRRFVVKLNVDTPEPIIVSKAKATDFFQWLEGAG